MKTVLLIWFDGLSFVGSFPSRSYSLAFFWEIDTEADFERCCIEIAVFPWRLCMTEFRIVVLLAIILLWDFVCAVLPCNL